MRLIRRSLRPLSLLAALLALPAVPLHAAPLSRFTAAPLSRFTAAPLSRFTAAPQDSDSDQPPGLYLKGAPVVPAVLRGLGVGALMASAGLLALLAWLLPKGGGAPRRAGTGGFPR